MVKMKTNKKKPLLASKKEKMHKIKNKTGRKDTKRVKSRGGRSLKSIKTKRLELKSKKVKKIVKPIRKKKVEEDAPIENFGNEEFVNFTNQVQTFFLKTMIVYNSYLTRWRFQRKMRKFLSNSK